ncbi:MAG: DUF1554 domain-containing protein [Leptospira sp.]|nr:DUF1554 domain-containing protein [Leptospira sp.]
MLEGDTIYYNLANQELEFTNSTASRFGTTGAMALINPISSNTWTVWTGIGVLSDNFIVQDTCSNWTLNSGSSGTVGRSQLFNQQFAAFGANACGDTLPLYCVEQNPRKRIFVTTNPVEIGVTLSGKTQADALCNDPADPRKPNTGYYKALLRFTDRTHPSTDWVLKPETTYYRTDRTTTIGTTNAASVFNTNFSNAISTLGSEQTYLGFGSSWTPSANNCNDYTDPGGLGGGGANSHSTVLTTFLGGFTAPCNFTSYKVICVEQ